MQVASGAKCVTVMVLAEETGDGEAFPSRYRKIAEALML